MRKRVSVKGKGADIFFGDYTQPETGAGAAGRGPSTRPRRGDVTTECKHAGKHAGKHARRKEA